FFLVQNDKVVLQSILNKALSSLTTQEIQALESKWYDKAGDIGREHTSIVPVSLLTITNENRGRVISYQQEGREYLAFTAYMDSDLGVTEQFGIVVPAHILMDPYLEVIWFSIYVAILLLLLSIPLVIHSANLIVKPIRILMNENEKVRLRKFDNVVNVQTRIKELAELSSSLVSMTEDIKTYQKGQQKLMDGFIKLVAGAIDCKSKYTGGHCSRVPELVKILAKEVNSANEGPFKEFTLQTDDEWRELFIGAWLHDCGKVTTPEYVVDKATKLETIFNRIHEVRTRFEVIWRDVQIEHYERLLKGADKSKSKALMIEAHKELTEDFTFIGECNIAGTFMSPEKQARVAAIASRTWLRHFDDRLGLSKEESIRFAVEDNPSLPVQEKLLSDSPKHILKRKNFDFDEYKRYGFKMEVPEYLFNYGEIYNLCIAKGTLTAEERFIINEHVIMSIKMLESLPLPENLKRVPEYAGAHHETMTGTGYPRKLSKKELSVPSRMMMIADIFEALTASDRPYKKEKKLSEAIKILNGMKNDGHIDPDLFELFLSSGVYLKYAAKHLKDEQIDEVDISSYLQTGRKI
ncbi:HD-GYP domain-containing protein, partial [Psychromonas aquimarina]|uniref:HD-GYP domain-containing protein n=1 Tax=Psychromonas aquimarina TaxID=444919 RepID=UPI00048BDC02